MKKNHGASPDVPDVTADGHFRRIQGAHGRPLFYVLEDGKPRPAAGIEELSLSAEIVAAEIVNGSFVSTVFLGIDHNHGPDGPPLVFETMVFSATREPLHCERYATLAEARAGHRRIAMYWPSWKKTAND